MSLYGNPENRKDVKAQGFRSGQGKLNSQNVQFKGGRLPWMQLPVVCEPGMVDDSEHEKAQAEQ